MLSWWKFKLQVVNLSHGCTQLEHESQEQQSPVSGAVQHLLRTVAFDFIYYLCSRFKVEMFFSIYNHSQYNSNALCWLHGCKQKQKCNLQEMAAADGKSFATRSWSITNHTTTVSDWCGLLPTGMDICAYHSSNGVHTSGRALTGRANSPTGSVIFSKLCWRNLSWPDSVNP